MNKRSAMVLATGLATGLAAALLVGAAGISTGLGAGGVASAAPRDRKPAAPTTHRTMTVHEASTSSPAPFRTGVIGVSSSSPGASMSGSEGEDRFETEGDGFEGNELEGDDGRSDGRIGGFVGGGGDD